MRQSKFTETQIVGRPVNEIWRQYGISSETYYKWKAKSLRREATQGIGAPE
jgi:transposase-like protein